MAMILLATGDAATHAVFSAELNGDGHEVLWAADGQEAYELTLAQQPELVLLDLSLPIFDAFETCSMLREDPEVPARLPIVLLTDEDLNPRAFEKSGFSELFPKTHQGSQLTAMTVRRLYPRD